MLYAGNLCISEDSIESDHTTISDFFVIFDMKHGETSRILVEIVHRTVLPSDYPIYIHLKKDILRIGILNHIVQHNRLIFYFLKFMRMIMISKFHTVLLTSFAYFIEIVAIHLHLFHCFRNTDSRIYDVFHACCFMSGNALIPPFQ